MSYLYHYFYKYTVYSHLPKMICIGILYMWMWYVCVCVCVSTKALLYTVACLVSPTVHSSWMSLSVLGLMNNRWRQYSNSQRLCSDGWMFCAAIRSLYMKAGCLSIPAWASFRNNGPQSSACASFMCIYGSQRSHFFSNDPSPPPKSHHPPLLHILQIKMTR